MIYESIHQLTSSKKKKNDETVLLMVKVFAASIFKHHDEKPIFLTTHSEVGFLNFFMRSTAREFIAFQSRFVASRTPHGTRQYVEIQDFEQMKVRACAYTNSDGLCCVVLIDDTYPQRVAHGLVSEMLVEFSQLHSGRWEGLQQDVTMPFAKGDELLAKFQDPEKADKLTKIRSDIEEVKNLAMKTLDDLMNRGEKLDDLVAKSNDLNAMSKKFYTDAKKNNQCCRLY